MTITRTQLNRITQQRERATLRAFNDVINSIKDQAVIAEIAALLNAGNVDGVIDLLQIDQSTYAPLADSIIESYRTGGITGAEQFGRIPTDDGTLVARFNTRSPAAEAWAASMSSRLVVEIVEPQRELLRTVITLGVMEGRSPRAIALDLVGRVERGRRVGGFIGLTEQQGGWILNARRDLSLISATQDEINNWFLSRGLPVPDNYNPYRAYTSRALRDRRFDAAILKAMDAGEQIPQALADRAITNMQNRAMRMRGETIARNEALTALTAGQHEAVNQALDRANVADSEIERHWIDGGDGQVRPDHVNVAPVTGKDTPFLVGGELLMYPRDPNGSAEQTIQCRCHERTVINFGARARRIEGF